MVGGTPSITLDDIVELDRKLKAAEELFAATKTLSKILKDLPEKSLKTENAIALLDHAIWRYRES
jgi:hypothetical protein